MSQDKISTLFDIPAIKKEYDEYLGITQKVVNDIEKINSLKINTTSKGYSESIKGLQEQNIEIISLNENLVKQKTIQENLISEAKKYVSSVNGIAKEYAEFDKELDVNIKRQIELKSTAESLRKKQAELKKEFNGNEPKEYANAVAELNKKERELKETARQLEVTIKNQTREFISQETSVNNISSKLNQLTQQYDKLTATQRNSESGQQLLAQIQELDAQKKELRATTGRFQENVGNYGDAFKQAFGQIVPYTGVIDQLKASQEGLTQVLQLAIADYAIYKDQVIQSISAMFAKTAATEAQTATTLANATATQAETLANVELAATNEAVAVTASEAAAAEQAEALASAEGTIASEAQVVANVAVAGSNTAVTATATSATAASTALGVAFTIATGGIILIVGALVATLAGLVSFLTRTDEGSEALARTWTGLKNVISALIVPIQDLGEKLFRTITENQTAVNGLKVAFIVAFAPIILTIKTAQAAMNALGLTSGKTAENIKNAFARGAEIERLKQDLEDAQRGQIANNAALQRDIEKLIIQSKNRSLTEKERLNLLDEASAKEKQLNTQKQKFAQDEVTIAQKGLQNAILNKSGQEDAEQKLQEAKAKSIELESESINLEEKIQNRRDALIDAEKEKRQKLLEKRKQEAEERKKILDEENKATEQSALLRAEYEAQGAQKAIDNQGLTLQERFELLQKYAEKEFEILQRKEANEIAQQDGNAKKIAAVQEKYAIEKLKKEDEIEAKFRALTDAQIQADIDANKKRFDEQAKQVEDFKKRIDDISKDETDFKAKRGNLLGDLEAGKIDYKTFQDEITKIKENAELERLKKAKEFADKEIQILQSKGVDVTKLQEQSAQIGAQIAESETQAKIKSYQKDYENAQKIEQQKKDLKKQIGEQLKALAFEIVDTIEAYGNAQFERETEALNLKQQETEDRYNRERDFINALAIDEETKAARIALINAKELQEKQKIEREKKKIAYEQAKFQQKLDIARAIMNTALGISNVFATTPPPLSFILAGIIGAIGALQIAQIVSAPLPKYKDGRQGGKAELAIVGEAGREIIETKEGERYLTPNTATLTYLPEGASVIPNYEIKNYANTYLPKRTETPQNLILNELQGIRQASAQSAEKMANAMAKQTKNNIVFGRNGLYRLQQNGNYTSTQQIYEY